MMTEVWGRKGFELRDGEHRLVLESYWFQLDHESVLRNSKRTISTVPQNIIKLRISISCVGPSTSVAADGSFQKKSLPATPLSYKNL